MLTEVKGLVVRTVDLADNDKLIAIISEERGKIAAYSNGSRTLKSRHLAATQLFCYASFVLYRKGERFWVREANLIESFFDLRTDLARTALAAYICDVADDVVEENAPEKDFLRLTLNTLYALSRALYPCEHIRAVFEMRAATVLGFMPMLTGCATCGTHEGELFLDVMNGTFECRHCRELRAATVSLTDGEEDRTAQIVCPLTTSAYAAICYAVGGPMKRLFSFRVSGEDMTLFASACEKYLLHHLERGFKSLDFYKQMLI